MGMEEPRGPGEMDAPRLLEEHGDSLLRLCTLYLGDRALAEDAVQDTFLRAMGAWGRFRGECSERTFLTRIAVNVCKNYLKSPWHRRRVQGLPEEALPAAPGPEEADDTLPRAVMSLPRKYREAVVLYYYEELKAYEIAALLGVSVSAVTVRLSRARGMLKQRLKGWYYGGEE